MEKVRVPAPRSLTFMQGGGSSGGDTMRHGEGNLLHLACSYSSVRESKQPHSIASAAEAEAKEGELTRRVARCATGWAHAPLWGEARQRPLREEMATI